MRSGGAAAPPRVRQRRQGVADQGAGSRHHDGLRVQGRQQDDRLLVRWPARLGLGRRCVRCARRGGGGGSERGVRRRTPSGSASSNAPPPPPLVRPFGRPSICRARPRATAAAAVVHRVDVATAARSLAPRGSSLVASLRSPRPTVCPTDRTGKILAADGSVSFTVLSTADKSVTVRVENDFELGERKNMNLPGVAVDLPVLTEKDKVRARGPPRAARRSRAYTARTCLLARRIGSDRIADESRAAGGR